MFHTHDLPLTEKLDYFSAFALVLFNLLAIILRIVNDFILRRDKKPSFTRHFECEDKKQLSLVSMRVSPASEQITFESISKSTEGHDQAALSVQEESSHEYFLRHEAISFSKCFTIAMPFVSFYLYHINYLSNVSFDYGYNMKVNATAGISSSVLWIIWAIIRIFKRQNIKSTRNLKYGIFCILYVNSCFLLELCDFPPVLHASFDPHSLWHLTTTPFPLLWFR